MKKNLSIITIIFILLNWQCSKNDLDIKNLSVKESVEDGVARINAAADKIADTKGFQLLSVSEEGSTAVDVTSTGEAVKSEAELRDSIELGLIAGIYEFDPVPDLRPGFFFPYKLFKKTGTSDNLVVNLPEQMVFHPKRLHFYLLADSVLKNNFKITATDYHFFYNWWNSYDYKLVANFKLGTEDIGNMGISTVWKSRTTRKFINNFNFPQGYGIVKTGQTGDTTRLVLALTQNKDTLLKETLVFTGDGFRRSEKLYKLAIGNVEIRKTPGIDSIQIYKNGVLQEKARAEIIENEDYNASIFYRRDILLTFEDGTQEKLSNLISTSLVTLRTLSRSLEEMYFSKHIVDYIAFNIYYNKF